MTAPGGKHDIFHPLYIRALCELIAERGVDANAALRDAGIDPVSALNGSAAPSLAALKLFLAIVLQRADCPWLGLELGMRLHTLTHGTVGFATAASNTVADAVRTIARFTALRTPALSVTLQSVGDGAVLQVRTALDLGPASQFVLEAFAVSVARLLSSLTGKMLPQVQYRLPWPSPPWAARYAEALGADVQFGAAALSMHYPVDFLHQPCLTADPEAYQSAQRALERGLAVVHGGNALPQRVRALIERSSPRYPSSAEVARQLNLSVRTLFRQLKQQGSSYQTLLDAARLEEAQWRLLHTTESIERIAERLGFVDSSNFARTFKRWTHSTPRAYRFGSKRLA